MLKIHDAPEDEIVPPECRSTVARIQSVLDGDTAPESLAADPHPLACSACRERVRAARVLLSVLAFPPEPVAIPAGFTERTLNAVREDRYARTRRRVYRSAAALALAAAVIAALFPLVSRPERIEPLPPVGPPIETAKQPDVAPAPREKAPAPEPPPIRFSDAVATTGQAIRETPAHWTEAVEITPQVFDMLTGPFKMPAPPADPMGTALAPARKSLEEIPVAARAGLEPVTATAEKALSRFLRDVESVKPNS